ncbi:hypothetical protein KOW79_022699 [Hemibagrus wyckioides]|uniref:Mannosyl-oligosaccharide glucosidase n=1 Tax=Hemibagrus wyckioides TaxID=337641 RepID=A0A9D3N3H9_9TELE|nr:hypothetical protein KOW79_022699 [Hemibagrus wyckioides]
MWMSQNSHSDVNLRHTCEQGDGLSSYSWLIHDGVNFGMQQIRDTDFTLITTFVKRMGTWWGLDLENHRKTEREQDKTRLSHVTGTSEELSDFKITFNKPTSEDTATDKYASYNYLQTQSLGLNQLTDIVKNSLSYRFVFSPSTDQRRPYIAVATYTPPPQNDNRNQSDFVVHQVTVQVPFQIEVLFESGSFHDRPNQLRVSVLTEELTRLELSYREKFEEAFSRVYSRSVPSRSFFPRGFLWDEGFHQLLISKWDPQVTREVVAHWLDLMNVEGWIPREQTLGDEALSKVPSEFVVQHTENANPPTFFLVLEEILEQLDVPQLQDTLPFMQRLYPRLQTWFKWYNTTQAGLLSNSYHWRGRDKDTNRFLNPKTLTSGLDDYPRASHPSEDERHVDLYCLMVLASRGMASMARLLGEPHQEYENTYETLSNNSLLNELHWSEQLHAFCDYGNHTQAVSLELVRSVHQAPELQYVNALGYVSLFSFLLHVLTPDSQKLEYIRDPARLWTPYGLRSLSRSDPIYMKRNTEHDAPYWRGAIWININYLEVRALHHYSRKEGPFQEKAADLYQELRTNVINNIYKQYQETGYIWEQYSDSTGQGQGSHPFTGWSALIVLIMAEEY